MGVKRSIWTSALQPLKPSSPKEAILGVKSKINKKILFLYTFWKSFINFVEKKGVCGSTSSAPRDIKFCMVVYIPKKNGISFAANSFQIFLHLGPP